MSQANNILWFFVGAVILVAGLVYLGEHTTFFNFLGVKGVVVH